MNGPSATIGDAVDDTMILITGISVVLLAIITGLMLYFTYRYSRKRHPVAEEVGTSILLEVTWTIIPVLIVMGMFWAGYKSFREMRDAPEDALQVTVIGRMWDWSFEYANGKKSDRLVVPLDQPVRLQLKSLDVNHSFYIPAFRIKEDVVPGGNTYLWFKPQSTGPADIFCAEYCGERHSYMMSEVVVVPQEQFDVWYQSDSAELPETKAWIDAEAAAAQAPSDTDEALSALHKYGCVTCHSLDGTGNKLGPTLKGVFGKEVTVMVDGKEISVTADEAYLKQSITQPAAALVKGFENLMPPPAGMGPDEIDLVIGYIKELK